MRGRTAETSVRRLFRGTPRRETCSYIILRGANRWRPELLRDATNLPAALAREKCASPVLDHDQRILAATERTVRFFGAVRIRVDVWLGTAFGAVHDRLLWPFKKGRWQATKGRLKM